MPRRKHGTALHLQFHARVSNMIARSQLARAVLWLVTAVLAIVLAYAAFRGYLGAELLIGFANGVLC